MGGKSEGPRGLFTPFLVVWMAASAPASHSDTLRLFAPVEVSHEAATPGPPPQVAALEESPVSVQAVYADEIRHYHGEAAEGEIRSGWGSDGVALESGEPENATPLAKILSAGAWGQILETVSFSSRINFSNAVEARGCQDSLRVNLAEGGRLVAGMEQNVLVLRHDHPHGASLGQISGAHAIARVAEIGCQARFFQDVASELAGKGRFSLGVQKDFGNHRALTWAVGKNEERRLFTALSYAETLPVKGVSWFAVFGNNLLNLGFAPQPTRPFEPGTRWVREEPSEGEQESRRRTNLGGYVGVNIVLGI